MTHHFAYHMLLPCVGVEKVAYSESSSMVA
jgi:hypothetical protein